MSDETFGQPDFSQSSSEVHPVEGSEPGADGARHPAPPSSRTVRGAALSVLWWAEDAAPHEGDADLTAR